MNESRGVSIVVPTIDRVDMLRESLTSLGNRTKHQPREIILVNAGDKNKHLPIYEQMIVNGLIDKIVFQEHKTKLTDGAYLAGLEGSNPEFPYIHFGADDLLYRTGWASVLVDMLESDWAKKNGIKIIAGFNHWTLYNDYEKMGRYVKEMYKSADGKVEGYAPEWGGNWFFRKDFFREIGGFVDNLKKLKVPAPYATSYEAIMQYKLLELGYFWGATRETYVQTMGTEGSSTLGNYRLDNNGNKMNNEQYKNGVAIGVAWKDE